MEGGVSGTLNIIELLCGSEKVSCQRELKVLVFVDAFVICSISVIPVLRVNLNYIQDYTIGQVLMVKRSGFWSEFVQFGLKIIPK